MKPNQAEALHRATTGQSLTNWPAIFEGFAAMGIPASEIIPRQNVLTFNAWKALGRVVRKGQHGVKVITWIDAQDKETGETRKLPRTTTVFHITQTEPLN